MTLTFSKPAASLSLKTRITLLVLAIFMAGIWTFAFYEIWTLRRDMERSLGEQQFSTVSLVASQIDQALEERVQALRMLAARVDAPLLADQWRLQATLDQYLELQRLFNGGVLALGTDGTALAEVPATAGRVGVNYMDQDTVASALREGKATIGRPTIGKKLQTPVFGMSEPILDASGKVIGALSGVINLGAPNVFGNFVGNPYGKSGGFFLVAPQYRLIVTATDRSRIMTSVSPPGVNPTVDRFLGGYDGSAVYTNSVGVEVLGSSKAMAHAGWRVAAQLPVDEAFAPVAAMQQRILLVAAALTTLVAGLVWWTLARQLAPMARAARALQEQALVGGAPHPLPVERDDEVGELIRGFDEVLAKQWRAELELRKLSLAVEQTSESIVITNTDADIEYANEAFFRATGYSSEELIGKNPRILQSGRTPPERFEELWQALRAGNSWRGELINRRKDGSEYIETASITPLRQADGTITHYVAVKDDITERKATDARLRQMSADLQQANETLEARVAERTSQLRSANLRMEVLLEELKRSNQDLERFAHVASHDLREPLRIMIGFARILEDEYAKRLDADGCEYLNYIVDGASRMQILIEDILRYSKLATLGAQRELVDLGAAAREAVAALGSQLADAGAQVEITPLPTVNGARTQLVQLFQNLIANAVRFCERAPLVRIDAARESGGWRLTVRDNGIGIAPQDRERIFVMFQRLHSRSKYPGSGIGLAICKRIIECHGGDIGVSSTSDEGSEFWFTIPDTEDAA